MNHVKPMQRPHLWPRAIYKKSRHAPSSGKGSRHRLLGFLWAFCLLALLLAGCGGQRAGEPAAAAGASASGSELFASLDCIHCHQMDGSGPGPSLAGLYGETIPLENGETVTVDDQFIRTSILDPRAQTHAGYPPIMPPYEGRIGEEELSLLVEYIRSLSG